MPTVTESGLSYVTYTAGVGDADFTIPFDYLDTAHIRVQVGTSGVPQGAAWIVNESASQVEFQTGYEPATGAKVKIFRVTPVTQLYRQFPNGTVLIGDDMEAAFKQDLFALQEMRDAAITGIIGTGPGAGGDVPGTGGPPVVVGPLTKNDFMLFVNGIKVHNNDFEVDFDGTETTITMLTETQADDKFEIRLLRGTAYASLDFGSVTEGALGDGVVSWGKLKSGGFSSWSSIADSVGPQDLFNDLNDRVETLEAGSGGGGGGGGTSNFQQKRFTTTIPTSSTAKSFTFAFTPDYVIFIHGTPSTTAGSGFAAEAGATFIVPTGTAGQKIQHRYGNDSDGQLLLLESIALSGTSLTFNLSGTGSIDGGTLSVIGVKE